MRRIIRAVIASVLGVTLAMGSGTLAYALWSSTATGKLTVSVANVPGPPQTFRCGDPNFANDNVVNLAWGPSGGSNVQYQVHRRLGTSAPFTYSAVGGSTTALTTTINRSSQLAGASSAVLVVRARFGSSPAEFGDPSNAILVTFGQSRNCGTP